VLALAAVLLALATPSPEPAPTNPFNLNPIPAGTPFPLIGTTRSRALCQAIRKVVAPAVVAAMTSDKTYAVFRKSLFDYTVNGNDSSRDFMLIRMDRSVDAMVKSTKELETQLDSYNFTSPANTGQRDAEALAKVRESLRGVLAAQKVELDAMSGFVETERMRTFGQLSETEKNMQAAVGPPTSAPNMPGQSYGPSNADDSSYGFLHDSNNVFKLPVSKISLDQAHFLDRDLGDLAAFTAKREDVASKAIIPATNFCK
jgi:hypothetical protein